MDEPLSAWALHLRGRAGLFAFPSWEHARDRTGVSRAGAKEFWGSAAPDLEAGGISDAGTRPVAFVIGDGAIAERDRDAALELPREQVTTTSVSARWVPAGACLTEEILWLVDRRNADDVGVDHDSDIWHWETDDGARMRAVHRPDGVWLIRLPDDRPDQWPALVDAATQDGCGTLLVSRPAEEDEEQMRLLRAARFVPTRMETVWRIPLNSRLGKPVRSQHQLVSVTDLDAEAVAALDNAIRADIPGTEGWCGTTAQLLDSLDDPEFDPALYRIARHRQTGSLDGLVRIWNRHPAPRIGCLGVTRPWRRTSLALALVQDVTQTLLARGVTHVTTETDNSNAPAHLMASNHGAEAVQSNVEWRRA